MIAVLIALGLLGDAPAAIGGLIAGAEQTVAILKLPTLAVTGGAIPLGAYQWPKPLDPSDRAPYAYDFSVALPDGSRIAAIERITMSAAGAAAGVEVDQQDPRRPIIAADGTHVQLWFLVDPEMQAGSMFAGAGMQVGVAVLLRTDSDPFQEYERTAVLTVRQL